MNNLVAQYPGVPEDCLPAAAHNSHDRAQYKIANLHKALWDFFH